MYIFIEKFHLKIINKKNNFLSFVLDVDIIEIDETRVVSRRDSRGE